MFFDSEDYLESDPTQAGSERERERLWREAAQRAKLCEATTRLAARGGLEAAAIHLAARSAGVGQGTYYKLYDTKEACLREAFERCADTVLGRVEDAARHAGDFAGRLEAGLGELLQLLDAHPEVARLLLVEILAGDLSCQAARERTLGRFAGLLTCERGLQGVPQRGSAAWMAAAALTSVLALRLEDNAPLPEVLGELVRVGSWPQGVEASMRVEGTTGDDEFVPVEAAQRSRQQARRRRARRGQRERILAAMTETAGTKGYRAARVTDVLRRAEVSAPVFYGHFDSKEECLLAAYDVAIGSILERVEAAVAGAATCAERAEGGLRALVESLAEQPARARVVTIEVKAAGDSGEERCGKALTRFTQLVGELGGAGQKDAAGEVAATVARTAAGAIAREVGEGRSEQLEALLPDLVFTALAPYLGGEKAAEKADAVRLGQAR